MEELVVAKNLCVDSTHLIFLKAYDVVFQPVYFGVRNLGEVLFTKSFSLINISYVFLYFGLIPLPYLSKGRSPLPDEHPISSNPCWLGNISGRYEWTHEIVPVKAPRLSQRLRFLFVDELLSCFFFFLAFFRSRLKHRHQGFFYFFLDSCILMRGRILYFKKAFLDGLLRPFEVITTVLEKFIEDHDVTGWPMPSWGRFHFFNQQNQVDWDVLLYYISITPGYIFPKQC